MAGPGCWGHCKHTQLKPARRLAAARPGWDGAHGIQMAHRQHSLLTHVRQSLPDGDVHHQLVLVGDPCHAERAGAVVLPVDQDLQQNMGQRLLAVGDEGGPVSNMEPADACLWPPAAQQKGGAKQPVLQEGRSLQTWGRWAAACPWACNLSCGCRERDDMSKQQSAARCALCQHSRAAPLPTPAVGRVLMMTEGRALICDPHSSLGPRSGATR